MSKILKINTSNKPDNSEKAHWGYDKSDLSNKKRHLFLFMIGGSGSSIIEPLLFYFEKIVKKSNYTIVPIFIDRNFHSEIVSRSISNIKSFQYKCTFSATNSIVKNPFFFKDDNDLFNEQNNLNLIIKKITDQDIVAISFSVITKSNIITKQAIAKKIRQQVNSKIFDLIFLPYFNLNFCEDEFFDGEKRDEDDFLSSNDLVKNNLSDLEKIEINEHCLYAGLQDSSSFRRSIYQQNPFNVTSLILSYGIATFLSKNVESENSYYTYGIHKKEFYSLDDLIPNSEIRKYVIIRDFKRLCWNIIWENYDMDFIKSIYDSSKDNIDYISLYLNESIKLIDQLSDIIVNRQIPVLFRKEHDYDFNNIWREFKYLKIFNHNKSTFAKEILSNFNESNFSTPNMLIHGVLNSIDKFIDDNYYKIESFYY